jgi:hypothetical protein
VSNEHSNSNTVSISIMFDWLVYVWLALGYKDCNCEFMGIDFRSVGVNFIIMMVICMRDTLVYELSFLNKNYPAKTLVLNPSVLNNLHVIPRVFSLLPSLFFSYLRQSPTLLSKLPLQPLPLLPFTALFASA